MLNGGSTVQFIVISWIVRPMLLLIFFRNSVWSKQLYISRFGCKQEAQKLIITHVNYGLNDEIFWEQIEFLLTMCVKYDQHHLYSLRLLAVIFDHCHLIYTLPHPPTHCSLALVHPPYNYVFFTHTHRVKHTQEPCYYNRNI